MARRPRPQVVTLTKAAADRIGSVLSEASDKYVGVRVGVKNGGCAGMEYVMDYAETAQPMDECVEDQGVRIFIDPKAILFLLGSEIDFQVDKFSARFVFNNPNQTDACGCGESVTIVPAASAQN